MQPLKKHYDLLIVGAGLFGSVIAHEAIKRNLSVLIVEKRNHIGGNCYTKPIEDINVHLYGAHIFRTSDRSIWNYMEQFCEFNSFVNSPIANYHGKLFNLPFNMNTFYQLWGVTTPQEAKKVINNQCTPCDNPKNLEEHILSLAGSDIYEKLVKGYTEKQWGKSCLELPPSIMRRIPLRFTFDNNYFNDPYQGIPKGGYTAVFEKLLQGAEIILNTDYLEHRDDLDSITDKIIYTGPVDAFYDFVYGPLEYRGLEFEHELLEIDNYQGVAVVNYTDAETPFTRIIEHKHFEFGTQKHTVVTREYPATWEPGSDPYYPMEDQKNRDRFEQYLKLTNQEQKIHFGGRLGEYRYYDMQDTIKSALNSFKKWFHS